MQSPTPLTLPSQSDIRSLFLQILCPEFMRQQAQLHCKPRQNNRVYTFLVVMWLILCQRLQRNGTLGSAVLHLLCGLPSSFWPRPCKRLQPSHQLSAHTGAYNKARQALPLTLVEHSCDRIFEQLVALADRTLPAHGRRAFFFDGTSVRLAHSKALCRLYPPGSNQNGEAHWPLLRMLVAHDLQTGLALRPRWGAMNGPEAVSEQALFKEAIDQLPPAAIVVGDANFGVFSVAYAADQREHGVILRLTPARAKKLLGAPLRDGVDMPVVWIPSRDDRKSHPNLPDDAQVAGRLIIRCVQPSNAAAPFLLALFTTLDLDQDAIVELYGQRWNVETDLRSLKNTLQLDQLSCTTQDMVAKELVLGIAAYNLVRAVAFMAAQKSGIAPRRYSFTSVQRIIQAFGPLIAAAKDKHHAQTIFDRMMYCVAQAKLPQRNRSSNPRAVWFKRPAFPRRKACRIGGVIS